MSARRTVVVLDDVPTGTQSARDVPVLVDPEADVTTALDAAGGPHYVLTNTRAMPSAVAVALLAGLRDRITRACARAGRAPEFVLRGDSTLCGHVFAESDVFGGRDAVLLFVPAFPEGGRTTVGGVHRVLIDGRPTPVADTEFAADPVFGYTARTMVDRVREVGDREAMTVPRGRAGGAGRGARAGRTGNRAGAGRGRPCRPCGGVGGAGPGPRGRARGGAALCRDAGRDARGPAGRRSAAHAGARQITKGGITAAEVASFGFGAARARALGPVLPGVPLWRLATPATDTIVQAVVPGNVGDDETLVAVGRAFAIM